MVVDSEHGSDFWHEEKEVRSLNSHNFESVQSIISLIPTPVTLTYFPFYWCLYQQLHPSILSLSILLDTTLTTTQLSKQPCTLFIYKHSFPVAHQLFLCEGQVRAETHPQHSRGCYHSRPSVCHRPQTLPLKDITPAITSNNTCKLTK